MSEHDDHDQHADHECVLGLRIKAPREDIMGTVTKVDSTHYDCIIEWDDGMKTLETVALVRHYADTVATRNPNGGAGGGRRKQGAESSGAPEGEGK